MLAVGMAGSGGACGGATTAAPAAPDGSAPADAASTADAAAPTVASVNRWTSLASMSRARFRLAAAPVVGFGVVAMGGSDGADNDLESIELYRPESKAWTMGASMSTRRTSAAAAPLAIDNIDGVIVIGGKPDISTGILATAAFYDPWKNTWADVASMSVARSDHAAAPVTIGGVPGVLAVGGLSNSVSSGVAASAEVYDATTKGWRTLAPMPTARFGLAAAPVTVGAVHGVLVVGGADMGHVFAVAELYDPVADRWTTVAPMSTTRVGAAAAPVTIGGVTGVLVVGGAVDMSGGGVLASCEFYDPIANVWRAMASMSTPRRDLAAGAVNIGGVDAVLAIGGSTPSTLATAELYTP
jgi:hypothetical protein